MSRRKLSAPLSRADLIASYSYQGSEPYWALGVSQADRDKAASSGAAMPDGRFPITECEGSNGSVESAIGLARTDAERAHVIKRANSLGCASKIPDSWNKDGSKSDTSTEADAFAAPPPPAADKQPAKPAPGAAAPSEDPDQAVTDALAEAKAAVQKAVDAQKQDPDGTSDPNDEKVSSDLAQISQLIDSVIGDQATDVKDDPVATTAAGPPPPPPVTPPVTNPTDEKGNVDNGAVCQNSDCGHMASSHANSADGDNTGPCGMQNCTCQGMEVEADPGGPKDADDDSDDDADGSGMPDAAKKPAKLAADAPGNAVPDAPAPPGPAAPAGPGKELNAPPTIPGGENMGPAFTIPVLIIEGQPTTDGREIAPQALSWRVPPLPLMGLAKETHDPNGFDMNDPSVLCGRIDTLTREPGEGETQIIVAQGFFLPNDDGMYFAGLAEAMGRIGVSGDVAVEATEMEVGDVDQDGFPIEMSETLTQGVIMGATIVPFPAFEGAYLVLGDGTEKPEAQAIPQQADQPVTPEKPPAAVTAGGQLVHLMTFEECAACDQGIEVVVASGQGPTRPPLAWFSDPAFHPDDGRMVEILDRRGNRVIGGKYACPLTIDDDGRVYGHIAPWGVCHTGHTGQCILAPKSKSDYAHFKRGQHVVTAEGETVRVGVITCDTGHAKTSGISATQAMAHYDNTALAAADVNIGQDEYGIWVAGAMRPDATEEQVRKLRASSISGDWRQLGGSLELVAALAVNQPGFPLAVVASGQHQALVAAGANVMDRIKHPAVADADDPVSQALRAVRSRERLQRLAVETETAIVASARRRMEALR